MVTVLWIVGSALIVVFGLLVLMGYWQSRREQRQLAYIRSATLPATLWTDVRARHPELADADWPQLESALRQFFALWVAARPKPLGLPSRALATLWGCFAAHPAYPAFCRQAFGQLLPPLPAHTSDSPTVTNDLRSTWQAACRSEGCSPWRPNYVPLLFALDQTLGMLDGLAYRPMSPETNRDSESDVVMPATADAVSSGALSDSQARCAETSLDPTDAPLVPIPGDPHEDCAAIAVPSAVDSMACPAASNDVECSDDNDGDCSSDGADGGDGDGGGDGGGDGD